MFKLLLVAAVVAVAAAQSQHGHDHGHGHAVSSQSIKLHQGKEEKIYVDGHAKYEYAYKVQDPHTHDLKSAHESRHDDVVKGVYSLHQPDGTVRVVEYHADKKSGFNANVKIEGHAKHIVPEHHHHHH